MIKSLRITDLATIEELEVELRPGFSVLTGETGAGKSILIESIRLVLGEKGSSDVIRTGKKKTSIEAIFQRPRQKDLLETKSDEDLCVQRSILAQGTGKSYIDGTLVPLKIVKENQLQLVDIYGQNDHVFLRSAENQLDYLDHYGGTLPLRKNIRQTARSVRQLFRTKNTLLMDTRERALRLEFLVYQIDEIEKAQLVPGEEDELRQERKILNNAAQIKRWIDEASDLTYNNELSLSSQLSQLQKIVEQLADYVDDFKNVGDEINQFSITTQELADDLMKLKEQQTGSPERLETIEARLSLIENLKRKYGGSVADVINHYEKTKTEYSELDLSQDRLNQLRQELDKQIAVYKNNAASLRSRREKAAGKLEKTLEKELSLLGMKKARFQIALTSHPLDPDKSDNFRDNGTEDVEFLLSPNPGEDLKPLRRIASGGELSRFMLALKSIGKDTVIDKTLIFDEIDAGIGGKTAEFVAHKLGFLSEKNQVICITHLPQIASFAQHHYHIEKSFVKDRTFTTIKELSQEERIGEIARLLGGSLITETTRQTAKEMLERNSGKG